jgi:hypothetical protein
MRAMTRLLTRRVYVPPKVARPHRARLDTSRGSVRRLAWPDAADSRFPQPSEHRGKHHPEVACFDAAVQQSRALRASALVLVPSRHLMDVGPYECCYPKSSRL